ncbi:MAG: hypothetical protein E6X17_15805 [Sporomusaceae bacterium]|nr:hypothetical protein [Sporomusaceae bacterium]
MRVPALQRRLIAAALITAVSLVGCSFMAPAKKPEAGPAGKPDFKTNPPLVQRFQPPPGQLYDLEATAGSLFGGLLEESWEQAGASLQQLQTIWQAILPQLGDRKNAGKAAESMEKLTAAVEGRQPAAAYQALNEFMGSVGDIGQNFKLSPLSDIIGIGNKLRNVSFYVAKQDWEKANGKAKELTDSWGQMKPSVESVGILGDVTRTHSYIRQLQDAVSAENPGAAEAHIQSLNDSIGSIRDYYRGK